jgi:hypothetical protein
VEGEKGNWKVTRYDPTGKVECEIHLPVAYLPFGPIPFKEETIWLYHPERSEGSLSGERSFAALRACPERSEGMTLLKRLL